MTSAPAAPAATRRYLSGIQPSGKLHLGNYFGMMKPALERQDEAECFYFIADLHAMNSVRDGKALRANSHEVALDFLAAGLDPERTVFFRQSDIPEIPELYWILGTVTPLGLLERCHAYKDKTARGHAPDLGLFAYPVLQAADILLYDSDVVPVGQDQRQHIEVTRDIATKVNQTYGEVFKLPEPEIGEEVATVPGIDGQKMSKSYGNTLDLFAPPKKLRKAVMKIVTDSAAVEDPKDPAGSTIVQLYRLVARPDDVARMEEEFRAGGVGYGDFKKRLFEEVEGFLGPMRERRQEIAARGGYVEEVLEAGAARARAAGGEVMERVRRAVGLGR